MTEEYSPSSIRTQLLKWLLIPLISLAIVTTLLAYQLSAWYANEAFDRELLSAAHNVAARLNEEHNGISADLPKTVQAVIRHDDRDKVFYQVLSPDYKRLAGDTMLPMPSTASISETPRFRDSQVNGMPVRMVRIKTRLPESERTVLVQVARTLNSRSDLINKILLSIVLPQIALICLTAVVVYVGVRHGLRPLEQLSTDLRKRSQLDLEPIACHTAPMELIPLITSLNSFMERLRTYIDTQQRFIANAAHQLRTPVAGLKAYIEYGRRVDGTKIKSVLDQLDSGTDRISDMVAGLLVLARAGDMNINRSEQVDINFVASEVCSSLVREATNKSISLTFVGSEKPAVVQGDAAELREMISNIVVNALRYTPEKGKVIVQVAANSPVRLNVTDTGPGIPPEERERVFERFYRVLGTRVTGSGLGLAIVNEIATAHNAKVRITDGPDGLGTSVNVSFAELKPRNVSTRLS